MQNLDFKKSISFKMFLQRNTQIYKKKKKPQPQSISCPIRCCVRTLSC